MRNSARDLGIPSENINPKAVLNYPDFHRSIKTGYELARSAEDGGNRPSCGA